MPGQHLPGGGIIDVSGSFKPGDPRPSGYNAFTEWAEVQHKAGLKQVRCGMCSKWQFPQELSGKTVSSNPFYIDKNKGKRVYLPQETPICNDCAAGREA